MFLRPFFPTPYSTPCSHEIQCAASNVIHVPLGVWLREIGKVARLVNLNDFLKLTWQEIVHIPWSVLEKLVWRFGSSDGCSLLSSLPKFTIYRHYNGYQDSPPFVGLDKSTSSLQTPARFW